MKILEKFPSIKALILDMDGVLWHDTQPIGNLPLIFERINQAGLKVLLATNNATKSTAEFVQKLAGFDLPLHADQILNSAQALGIYLKQQHPTGGQVYILGEAGLHATLADYGFMHSDSPESLPLAVIAALDFHLTYEKLRHASLMIQKGIPLIGTNPDLTLPTPHGQIPGAGTIIRALEAASGKKAIIIGKPEPLMYQLAMKKLLVAPHETLAVGDRLETDIAGAQKAGCLCALVLTGIATIEDANAWQPAPDIVVDSLEALTA